MSDGQVTMHRRPWGEMAVHEWPGCEPGFLYLHGHSRSAADWGLIRSHLPAPVRTWAVDFPAHGGSAAPGRPFTFDDLVGDVLDLIATRGLVDLTVVGHSLGGMVAIAVADECPKIRSLVLAEGWTRSAAWSAFDASRHRYGSLNDDAIADIEAGYRRLNDRLPEPLAGAFWETVCAFDGYDMLSRIAAPAHEIYGTAGRRADTLDQLAIPVRPSIQLHWVEGAGHFLPQERPNAIARLGEAARRA